MGQLDAIPGVPTAFEEFLRNGGAAQREGSPMPDFSQILGPAMAAASGGAPQPAPVQQQRTLLQRVLPLFHLLLMIGLVAYFTFVRPPHGESWNAWADLRRRKPQAEDIPAVSAVR